MEGGKEGDDILASYMAMENVELIGHNNHDNKLIRPCYLVDEFSSNNEDNDKINDKNYNDNSTNNKGVALYEAKKAMPPHKLAELWNVDPKRAKRILANRQSAARSKERKARYTQELEKKARSLQTQATTLSAQLSLFKRDTTGLSNENIELRRQLESMEQQAHLRDCLNDALKQELDRLQVATGETSTLSEAFAPPINNISHHPQQQQQQQQQQLSGPFGSNTLPIYQVNIQCPPLALDPQQNQSNMLNLAQQHKFCSSLYLPQESSKLRNPPQFSTNATNMNYPAQPLDSPLGHLPPYALESNTPHSPENEVYITSQQQIPNQDQISRFQGLDSNSFN